MWSWTQAVLFVFGGLALAGCGKSTPVSPTPTPGPGLPTPVSMTIRGPTSLDHPGDTGQLTATVTFSDNTSRDVTVDASWTVIAGSMVAITGPGLIRATGYGLGNVSATYLTVEGKRQIRVVPAGAFLVEGWVMPQGRGFPALAQASVEFSSRSGTYRTTTNESGHYFLPAAGETTMRVERDGFRAQVKQMMVERDESVDFELDPIETADDLSGAYRLIVTASASCVLPPEVRQRSYDARILQMQRDLFVLLTGANLVAWGGSTGFIGSRDTNVVRFVVRGTFDDGYNFIEQIDSAPRRDLYYSGTAAGDADETRIVAAFSGKLELRSGLTTLAKCEATDHRFELTRVSRGLTPRIGQLSREL